VALAAGLQHAAADASSPQPAATYTRIVPLLSVKAYHWIVLELAAVPLGVEVAHFSCPTLPPPPHTHTPTVYTHTQFVLAFTLCSNTIVQGAPLQVAIHVGC
jgi:hypothetical protein